MDPESFLSVLLPVGHTLLDLLGAGVLYTDLNPGNVLIRPGQPPCLIDYTGAYYYRRNPRPDYRIRFSYRLSSDLPGPRLLIQELALMLESYLIDYEEKKGRPPCAFLCIQPSGIRTQSLSRSDSGGLSFHAVLCFIKDQIIEVLCHRSQILADL
jgi:hypothetical protein